MRKYILKIAVAEVVFGAILVYLLYINYQISQVNNVRINTLEDKVALIMKGMGVNPTPTESGDSSLSSMDTSH